MKVSHWRSCACAVFLLAATGVVAGCHATPRQEDDPDLTHPGSIERMFASDYWTTYDVPPLKERNYRRVAIAEFSVEFVNCEILVGGTGPATRVDFLQYTPIGLINAIFGIGRRFFTYEEDLYETLPKKLYMAFVKRLRAFPLQVASRQRVVHAPAYSEYEVVNKDVSSFFRWFNPVGSDTGRIRKMVTYPVEGLDIILGGDDVSAEDVDLRLLRELKADLVLRARFRVGIYNGHATVERGSLVKVSGEEVLGEVESRRSIVSREKVLKDKSYTFFVGSSFKVDTDKYVEAMDTLFPKYLSLRQPQD